MSPPPWMLVRFVLETQDHHAQADEDRLAALRIRTETEYRAFLVRVYGFEGAVEHALARLEVAEPVLARSATRVARLQQDLEALGMTSDELASLPLCTRVKIPTWSSAFGWLFVVERLTLFSGLIWRHLMYVSGKKVRGACAYLASSGEAPGARFRAFGLAASEWAQQHTPGDMVTAANDAFRAQRNWYRRTDISLLPPSSGSIRREASTAHHVHAESSLTRRE